MKKIIIYFCFLVAMTGCFQNKPDLAFYIKYDKDVQAGYYTGYHKFINVNKHGKLKTVYENENPYNFYSHKNEVYKLGLEKFERVQESKVLRMSVDKCQKIQERFNFNFSCKNMFISRKYKRRDGISLVEFYLSKVIRVNLEDQYSSKALRATGIMLEYKNRISVFFPKPEVIDVEMGPLFLVM